MCDENEEAVLSWACNEEGMPERRHSSTEPGRGGSIRVTVNRRHSLPSEGSSRSSAGCIIEMHGRDVSPESTEVKKKTTKTTRTVPNMSIFADLNA